jgi:hypothetical protein
MLMFGCALGFGALYRSAGSRSPVLVAAHDIGRFEQLDRDDLRVSLMATEPGVSTVPESDLGLVVGRITLNDLPKGTVLSLGQLAAEGQALVGPNKAVVGARLGPGAAPLGEIAPGTLILIVVRPDGVGGDAEVRQVEGRLEEIGQPNPNTDAREASLVVPKESAAAVAAAAADERIAVVRLEAG